MNKRKVLTQARKFSNMFRFIDGLAAINDGGEFEKMCYEICRSIFFANFVAKNENLWTKNIQFHRY